MIDNYGRVFSPLFLKPILTFINVFLEIILLYLKTCWMSSFAVRKCRLVQNWVQTRSLTKLVTRNELCTWQLIVSVRTRSRKSIASGEVMTPVTRTARAVSGNLWKQSIECHQTFRFCVMTKSLNKYYIHVFLLIEPGFAEKTGSDERVLFLKIASSAWSEFEEQRCHPW